MAIRKKPNARSLDVRTVGIGGDKKKRVNVTTKKSGGVQNVPKAQLAQAITIYVEPELLAKIDKYVEEDSGSREAFVRGALIGHVADREIEESIENA